MAAQRKSGKESDKFARRQQRTRGSKGQLVEARGRLRMPQPAACHTRETKYLRTKASSFQRRRATSERLRTFWNRRRVSVMVCDRSFWQPSSVSWPATQKRLAQGSCRRSLELGPPCRPRRRKPTTGRTGKK
ncbi:unnamed protein product, partial [Symbiodinium sp. CCMP2456]